MTTYTCTSNITSDSTSVLKYYICPNENFCGSTKTITPSKAGTPTTFGISNSANYIS